MWYDNMLPCSLSLFPTGALFMLCMFHQGRCARNPKFHLRNGPCAHGESTSTVLDVGKKLLLFFFYSNNIDSYLTNISIMFSYFGPRLSVIFFKYLQ